jgi:hypothetical protein
VTVLFADVVHSMDIAAAVGAERLREIMAELANRSAAVVQRYGGTVDKFTGDGIMALFGAPIALEDHALRACLAALEIQDETQRIASTRFEELRELCIAAGDNASLAIGMAGVVYEHEIHGRVREARQVVSEQLALAELTGDPALTADVSVVAIAVKHESGDVGDVLRLSQTTIEMADADPDKGNTIFGSPLAIALAARGSARFRLGRRAWRDDFDQAVAMACGSDPLSHAIVITYTYLPAIPCGALLADDRAVHDIAEALQVAEQSVNDVVLGLVRTTMGVALMHRDSLAERERGLELLGQVRDMCLQERFYQNEIRVTEMYTALERARGGDRDGAVLQLRDAIDRLFDKDQLSWSVPATRFSWRRCWPGAPRGT